MKLKTSELTGTALDWAVARREFPDASNEEIQYFIRPPYRNYQEFEDDYDDENDGEEQKFWYHPSSDWAQGGPIINREKITVEWTGEGWMAYIRHDEEFFDPKSLVAAMRAYVADRFGDDIEVPNELMEAA